jgi:hypothetical protein
MGLKNLRQNLSVESVGEDLSGIITTMAPVPGSRICGALLLHLATDTLQAVTSAPPARQSNLNYVLSWKWSIRIRRNAARAFHPSDAAYLNGD